ncbi:hypothetical protein GQ54DRAFT_68562 [Martensiomyces pterosporus]|nr:hypothetical protein GQ54DRAFT_68562 [Martensiomyces pterosporus]
MSKEYTAEDVEYMRMAIDEGKKCSSVESAYNVGAVIVKDGKILSRGFSRQLPGNTHAEQCALITLAGELGEDAARGATMYTTMEPCSKRLSGNVPCVNRILDSGIATVFVGVAEPPNFVQCTGMEELANHGLKVVQIKELEDECKALNIHLAK